MEKEIVRKLPIGVQSFDKLREEEYLYVDKTAYIDRLVQSGGSFFLSRPRRFGKSLLLSTLKAYWEGKKGLFRGLAIEKLSSGSAEVWQAHPVFYFDFNGVDYRHPDALEIAFDGHLRVWEKIYGEEDRGRPLGERFQNLLMRAARQTGRRCVVLVDEYDKPLLETMEDPELAGHNKNVFKSFFSKLKTCDEFLQFVLITGVTKFSKISIFSDLNQLRDISMSRDYACICGITEKELKQSLQPEVVRMAEVCALSEAECLSCLKKTYDGYRFHPDGEGVYNPFSLLNALTDGEFRSYWFATGTPAFLVRRLKKIGFDVRRFTDETLFASEALLSDYLYDDPDPVPLLYQAGYLTIWSYDVRRDRYTLGFPNEEVKYGFLESLMPVYTPASVQGKGTDIYTLEEYIEKGDTDGIRDVLKALFASIPYTEGDDPFEHYFQTVIYLVFTLLGKYVVCEMHTASGRIDCSLETARFVYLFEFKRDGSADEALQQIREKGYALPYASDARKQFMIGVSFDSASRLLKEWKVEE